MTDLKPCPFCGEMPQYENMGQYYKLECKPCFMVMRAFRKKDLLEKWNNRAERTCEDLKEFANLFTCSSCGVTQYERLNPNYCPECGARVIGVEE